METLVQFRYFILEWVHLKIYIQIVRNLSVANLYISKCSFYLHFKILTYL